MKNKKRKVFDCRNKTIKNAMRKLTVGIVSFGMVFSVVATSAVQGMNLTGTVYAETNNAKSKAAIKTISYEFKSTDDTRSIPQKVLEKKPIDITGEEGATIQVFNIDPLTKADPIEVDGVKWRCKKYADDSGVTPEVDFQAGTVKLNYTVKAGENKLIILWEPISEKKHNISYKFESSDSSQELPQEVLAMLPKDFEGTEGKEVKVEHISKFKDVVIDGVKWRFDKYKAGVQVKTEGWFSKKYVYTVKTEDDQKIVALWKPIHTYSAKYEFVGKDGITLPEEVMAKLPKEVKGKEANQKAKKQDFADITVKENGKDVTYHLDSWNEDEHTFVDSDFTFKATWSKFDSHKVTFKFESATEGKDLPQSVKDVLPKDIVGLRKGDALTLPKFTEIIAGDTTNPGQWTFGGYENTPTTMGDDNIEVVGKWSFKEANYNGSIIFVNDSGEQTVNYTDKEQTLNYLNNLDEGDKGGGFSKKYFVGWSDTKNYDGRKGKAFYGYEKIKDVFPDGLEGGKKLYPAYLTAGKATALAHQMSGTVTINKVIPNVETMFNKLTLVDDSKKDFYLNDNLDENLSVKLGASFETNPFIQAVVRNGKFYAPGGAEYYGNEKGESTAPTIGKMSSADQYTFMDLHVKVDDRIILNDEIKVGFKSYSWYPHMVLKNKLDTNGNYEKFDDVTIVVTKNNPEGIITFKPGTEKEFIIRARVRMSRNHAESIIENPSFADVAEDMELISKSDDNFKVSKADLVAIAKGEKEKLKISGDIQGGAKLYSATKFGFTVGGPMDITKIEAKDVLLGYKFNHVTFNKNSASLETNVEQDLGTANVINGKALSTDSLNTDTKPVHKADTDTKIEADTIADNPADIIKDGKTYRFKEWNTKPDGMGDSFTHETVVTKDITVYAIWEEVTTTPSTEKVTVTFNENGHGTKPESQEIDKGTTATKPTDLTAEGYEFLGWFTEKEGGSKFKFTTTIDKNIELFAHWKEVYVNNQNVGGNTNTYKPNVDETDTDKHNTKPIVIVENAKPSVNTSVKALPQTGETNNNSIYSGIMLLASSMLAVLGIRKRKKHN